MRPSLTSLLAAAVLSTSLMAQPRQDPAMVIVDASQFLDHLPELHEMVAAGPLNEPWLFNNMALRATTRHNPTARVTIPEDGSYHVYIRSKGGQFRVAVNDQVIGENVAHETMELRRVGRFDLRAGSALVRAAGIEGTPVIDVIVLSKRDDLRDEDLLPHQYDPEIVMLRDYTIPVASTVKFGDLTGDGRMDMLVITRTFSVHAIDHDGKELWNWQAPGNRQHEPPGLVWDTNGNGRSEVIHWRLIDGQEWLVIADGPTGEILHRAIWPTQPLPHDWSNFRLAVGQLNPGQPDSIIVFTDSGRYSERQGDISVAAYDFNLNQRWRHHDPKLKDHYGHYVYPIDLTGDGIDEVVVSALVLDSTGKQIWNRFDYHFRNHEHMDSIRFADLTGDGDMEIITPVSDMGVMAYKARTGELVWQHNGEHTQQIEAGRFLTNGPPGLHIAAGARTYEPLSSQVWWLSAQGELISKWPANRISGNPVFVRGDWYGNGSDVLFWHRFRLNGEGRGELYFDAHVYHMFDFTGNGAEQVITLAPGRLRVFGHRNAPTRPALRSTTYLKNKVANHTHY